MPRYPVYIYNGCWIICEKLRKKNGHQANHLGTQQNHLGTPLGVPTPGLGSTAVTHTGKERQTNTVPYCVKV